MPSGHADELARTVRFADCSTVLRASGPRSSSAARWVTQSLDIDLALVDSNHPAIALCDVAGLVQITLQGHARDIAAESAEDELAALLTESLIRRISLGPVFHAAAIVRDGRAIILPASSGSGKSTLTAELCAYHGYTYLTDEAVCLLPDGRVLGLTRPLHLKPGSAAIAGQLASPIPETGLYRFTDHTMIAPLHLGWQPNMPMPKLAAVVFPQFDAHISAGSCIATTVTAAKAVTQLLATIFNPSATPNHGYFEIVTNVLALTPCRTLRYGPNTSTQIATILGDILA